MAESQSAECVWWAIVRERNVCVCVLCMCLAGIQKELPESIVPFNAGGPRCDIIYITDIYCTVCRP